MSTAYIPEEIDNEAQRKDIWNRVYMRAFTKIAMVLVVGPSRRFCAATARKQARDIADLAIEDIPTTRTVMTRIGREPL